MSTSPSRCPSCRTPGQVSKLCAGCRNVYYCSTECQQADWPVHKLLCRTWKDVANRPAGENVHRILHLPVEQETPVFLWREIQATGSGGVAPIDIEEMIGTKPVKSLTTTQNLLLRSRLPYAMTVFFSTIMDDEGTALNQAAGTLVAGRSTFRWRGPIVAIVGSKKMLPSGGTAIAQAGDMDLNHCADFVAFLLDNQNQDPRHGARTRMGKEWTKVQACRLACRGMVAAQGAAAVEVVEVPPAHYMFDSEANVSPLSRLVGMPLHMVKYLSSRPFVGDDLVNVRAAHMQNLLDMERSFTDLAPGVPRFGEPPMEWLSKVGNVLVARQDREPLDRDVLEAFADFCEHQFDVWYQWGYVVANCKVDGEPGDEAGLKQLMLNQFTPAKWQEYLFAWTSVARLAERLAREPTEKGKADLREMISDFDDYALDAGGAGRMLKRMLQTSFAVMAGEDS